MFLKLRVIFTVLCALCLAAVLPVLVWGSPLLIGAVGGAALLFFALMLLCKQSQEKREAKQEEEPADFLHPKK